MKDLSGKSVLLGVTGSIAAFKAAALASALVKEGAKVHVVMTRHAMQFIAPMTFEELCATTCVIDNFEPNYGERVSHLTLAREADLAIIAPCTANVLAKLAHGIADDMLTTTMLPFKKVKLLAPAMNTDMYENAVVQDNLAKLESYGYKMIEPTVGLLACRTVGRGKMAEPSVLLAAIKREIAREKTLSGRKVLLTAGATREALDPVRFFSNPSTGKMGMALAWEGVMRGAEVVAVTGDMRVDVPEFVRQRKVETAAQMLEACLEEAADADDIIMTAAVSDFRPKQSSAHKIKKSDNALSVEFERTEDILAKLASSRPKPQRICGFAMETENLVQNAELKFKRKNLDMLVANPLDDESSGFAHDTNLGTIITKSGLESLPLMSKSSLAREIWDRFERLTAT
ncbi:MAG: bifunctional phosphopantothenoylcysteine decarboxylase/phosphopantothenate--cysteine ligase CoaBC [Bradymonadales bacterium]|jgi:phosphopantothenoylcysteine decarboxylase/phosphopantothenate--cysteine ligase